jgi:uncharacterized protein
MILKAPQFCHEIEILINHLKRVFMIKQIISFFSNMLIYVATTLYQDGLYLFISIFIAVLMAVYIDPAKIRKLFLKKPAYLVPGSVGVGALTPLCACGTMAVVFSLLTTALPWGPIMAFLVSSPLMSPDTFVLLAGFVGIKFAVGLTVTSIILGLAAGFITNGIEMNTTFLNGQLRLKKEVSPKLSSIEQSSKKSILLNNLKNFKTDFCCTTMLIPEKRSIMEKYKIDKMFVSFYDLGIKKVLPLFTLFVAIAYLLKTYVPESWIMTMFSGDHLYSIPLAAIIGLPLYISDATVVPLLQVLKNAGASEGALMAFMISGPATSLGVIGGLNLIMKKKAILLYLLFILLGAILLGLGYDALLMVW